MQECAFGREEGGGGVICRSCDPVGQSVGAPRQVADSRVRAKTNLFHTSVALPGPRELKFKIAC